MTPLAPLPLRHLLVPLDGSALAEAALPAAAALGQRLGARLTLLHVLERGAPERVHGDRHLRQQGEAEAYLAEVGARLGGPAAAHVHPNPEGDVAASIADHAAELGVDLILLCAHGSGGARGWLTGAMAQQVIRRAAPPVLLLRPPTAANEGDPPFAPAAVLIALDGTPEGEAALPAALALAGAFAVPLRLLVAVATLGTLAGDRIAAATLVPGATAAALDLEAESAAAYLAALADRCRDAGFAVAAEVRRGDPARSVADAAGARTVVALATHGRAGFDALWAGSVGSRVVGRVAGRVAAPLLLVHPEPRR